MVVGCAIVGRCPRISIEWPIVTDANYQLAVYRLHVVLASDPALRGCTGSAATQQAEKHRVTAALQRVFSSIDEEILHKSRREQAQDGSTGLVLLRIGIALFVWHDLAR